MSENTHTNALSYYTESIKMWSDLIHFWTPSYTEKGSEEYQNKMGEWSKIFSSWLTDNNVFAWDTGILKDMRESTTKLTASSLKLWTNCLGAFEKVGKSIFETNLRLSTGDGSAIEKLFDELTETNNQLMEYFSKAVKDTPLAPIEAVDAALKNSMSCFPDEEKMITETMQQLASLSQMILSTALHLLQKCGGSLADFTGGSTISAAELNDLRQLLIASLQHMTEIMKPFFDLLPNYEEIANTGVKCGEKSFDVIASLYSVSLGYYEEATKVAKETFRFGQEITKGEVVTKPGEFTKKWTESYKKSVDLVFGTLPVASLLPQIIEQYTDCLKTLSELRKKVLEVPYATKEDLEKIANEIAKLSEVVNKKVSKTAEKQIQKNSSKEEQKGKK